MSYSRVLAATLFAALVAPCNAFEIHSRISPSITAEPIEIVVWVKPGVTPENETRVLAEIERGLRMWEDVPTSEIRFQIVSVVRSPTQPWKRPQQISITVGNTADLTSGGASLPSGGYPGSWFGAAADAPWVRLAEVTAHEIGHTLGLLHTTIDLTRYPWEQCPIMRWAIGSPILRPDDIAAVSSAYPERYGPALAEVAARIRGRVVVAGSSYGLTGVNVVAEDVATGVAAVARMSGFAGSPGSFDLPGLPPGTYVVRLLDAHSYRGSALRPAGSFYEMSGGYQADNFADASVGPWTVGIGDDLDLGDLEVAIEPLAIDAVHVGPFDRYRPFSLEPVDGEAPVAIVDRPYEVWLRLRGGVRDLRGTVSGLPPGLAGWLTVDPRTPNSGVHGSYYAHLVGEATAPGDYAVEVRTTDRRGVSETTTIEIPVRYEGAERVPDLALDGVTHAPETPRPFEAISFAAQVRNTGDARSEAALLTITIAGRPGKRFALPELDPGASATVETIARLPRGTWPYEVVVELGGETDTLDNRASGAVTVGSGQPVEDRPLRREPFEPR